MAMQLNPYQAPAADSALGPELSPDEAPLASRTTRLAAVILDGLLSVVILLPLQIKFGVLDNFPKIRPLPAVETAAWAVAGFVLWLAIHGYFLATRSQTVGKRLLNIQIVNVTDGRPASFGKLVLARYLPTSVIAHIPYAGGVVNFVGILLIFRDDRRCLHDLIAGTKVVEYRSGAPASTSATPWNLPPA